jgi:DNA-binding FrmR family transcriptional regulator
MDVPVVIARLKRIEGQIRGIIGMVQKDVPCDEILVQIGAAKAALHKTGQIILEGHLHHCVLDGIQHGDAEKTMDDLAKAVEHFSRMS